MEGLKAQGRGNADEGFSTIHSDQGGDTIRKLSQQTDNLLAVICLLQNQFEAVKIDVKGIKENVAKLGPGDNARESRKSKKQVLPYVLRPEACSSLTDPTDPPFTEKDPELRAVWPYGRLEPMQEKSQLYCQVEESDSSRHFPFSANVPIFGASSDQMEGTSNLGAEASPPVQQKWKESQNGRKIRTSSKSKEMMQLDIKPEPASFHSNSASSECKTENVFDELVNLKNEFQEWRVASSLIPAQLRLEMRHLASAQKEQEHKIDELRRFLNLQTHTFIDQQKLLLDEMKRLSQKQTSFSDDLNGMEEKIRANQGWSDYEELLDGMYQQNEDICEVMMCVGKQIKELKMRVKEQSSWSWRCDTCMASNPLKEACSQKFTCSSAGALITGPPGSVGGKSGVVQSYDPHDEPSTSLLESLDLTTGDEGEEMIFKARGKLFRYNSNIKAWQEGCVGEVKILKNLEIGRARLLMKTEKVHQICVNHWLKPDMQLLHMSSSDCVWIWDAIDFAKGEKSHERFSLEFKTPDLAAEFKKTFDSMKQWKEKSFERAEPIKARQLSLLKDKSSGHNVISTNSYGLRKKLGCMKEEDDLDDVLDDSDDNSDENQPQRQERSSLAGSAFEIPTAKPNCLLIKSPTPASQSLVSHLASTKPVVTQTSQSLTLVQSLASHPTVTTQSLPASQSLATYLGSIKPTVTTQSPPPPQSLASHMASSKSTVPTQSTLVSFFNKIPVTLSSFVSSQTFQIPKSTAPVTTTSASSPFAGFSFQTTPSKKDTPSLFGSNTSSTLLASTEHTVTTQSPPPSLSLASHLTSTIPTVTTQSRFAGFPFNKTPDTSSSFASSQTFQISKSTVSVTTTSTSPLFAGPSFQTTPSKKDPPSLFGSNTSATQLASTKPTVTTQSPPPSQFLDFHVASSKSMETTQSRFAGFSFNKTPGTSASFASSQTFQIPQSPAPVTTTSTSSCFASGFSFRNTPSKKGTPNLFGLNTSSQPSKDGSAALQYPHLKAPLIGDANKEEEGNVESLRSGFLSPSQSCETSQRKPGESLMGVTSSAPQKKEDKSNTTPLKGCRGCDEEDSNKPIVVEHKLSTLCPEKPKDISNEPFQFAGAGAPLFGPSQQYDDNVAEDQECNYPHYDPVISLPENVDLTTGDEGQEVVFKERAKLYCYDGNTQAWKERGVGDMKILVNPETGKARILMRREQVFKVCANHWLKPDMQLLLMSSSDRAFVWNAIDFAEGEECYQQFALKFKTPKLAAEFKKTFDEMKEGVKPSLTKPVEPLKEKPTEPVEEMKPAALMGEGDSGHRSHQADPVVTHPEEEEAEDDYDKYDGEYEGEEDGYEDEEEDEEYDEEGCPEEPCLADQFKPTPGSWDCDTCMVNNPADKNQCLACSTTKPGAASQPSKGSSETQPSLSEMFKPASGSWVCDSCMINNPADKVQCMACSTPNPGSSQPSQGTSCDSQGTPGRMGMPSLADQFKPAPGSWNCDTCMVNNPPNKNQCLGCSTAKQGATAQSKKGSSETRPGGSFSLGNFKFSGFSSNPSFSAGSGFGSSGFNKFTPGTFSFGQTPSQSSNTTPSSSAGFSFPPGGFSFTQPKPETSQSSDSGGFKMSVSSSFSFTAPPPHDPESTKSTLPSTTKEQPLSKPTEAVPGQQTITTPKFNFGSGMLQFTFGGTNQGKPSPGLFGSTSASSGATSQAASTSSYSTTNQPGCVFGAVQTTPVFGATTEKGSLSAFKGFVFGTKQSEPRTENKKAISFSDLVKNQGEFSFRLNVDNVASSLSKSGAKSPAKSPVLNNSKKYYQDEERDDIYFEPVVTLPENYKLETGEEDEEVKFSQRAKLYRFDMEGSQWKERGVGNIKVLYNPETKQYRIVMRREQVLRVCANHYITQHVNLQPNKGSERSWVWQAMDSSDGDPQNEQLAVRFKTEDAAREYKEVVDEAKKDLLELTSPQEDERNCDDGTQNKQQVSFSDLVKSEGQFTFRLNVDKVASSLKCTRKSPVKSPVLNKSGEYYHEEERDDTYFEPVVTLPENYKLETGEENEEVKFSQRARLYRFDIEGSQWKERGVGNIKVLYNPETKQYRIVMRREQVLRVCANHYITQHVNLQPSKGSEKSWVWRAMDSSDGDPQNEQLAVRFKTEDAAREFKDLVDEAKKDLLDKHKGDEEPSRLANEEKAKEEKEEKSSMDCMFSAPADLLYADENKDWQLRGKGQFQILFDKDDKNFLVEMRRDKDNSLCAKHLITKAIQLMPMRGQDRSYVWSAMDSSDKEGFPVSMTFAVRFKNRETADNFQEEFQRAQIGPWPGQNCRRAVHNKWYTYR